MICAASQVRVETNAEQLERLTAEMEQMRIQQVLPAPLLKRPLDSTRSRATSP